MEGFATHVTAIKEEPDDELCYMNLSDNFQSPTTSSYFAKPPSDLKTEPEEGEDVSGVAVLDPAPKVKEVKKRGRPKKTREEGSVDDASPKSKGSDKKLKQDSLTEHLCVKKKRDRFNGMPEEEVLLRHLPDILAPNLDILIIGINPGLFAAYVGHHYAGPGNHFWKCLYLSGLIPEPMNAYDDFKLTKFGIGFTNICPRTTRGSSDLRKSEIKEGGEVLKRKIMKYRPRIAVFNGKGIYEVFSGKKDFNIGKQPETVDGTYTHIFVMPSSSARCAQLPRASDKVPFFLALKKFRDYLVGDTQHLDESEIIFPNVDMRTKPDIKCEKTEVSESAAELTLEEIQSRAEFLDALEASAEGREIPAEKLEKNLKRRLKGASDDEDSALTFEDEESSQSSGSSDALRGLFNTDGSNSTNYGAYCYSKNTSGSSSFEVISSSNIKEELGHEDISIKVSSPLKSEKDEAGLNCDRRGVYSPNPKLSRQSPTLSPMTSKNSQHQASPLYTNLCSPKSQTGINTMTNTTAGKGNNSSTPKSSSPAAPWQHCHSQPSPSLPPNNPPPGCGSDVVTHPESVPRQSPAALSSSYMSPQATAAGAAAANNNSPHTMTYSAPPYAAANPSARSPAQPATIPYHPNNAAGTPMAYPGSHSGPAGQNSNNTGHGGPYKTRPPLHHQWSAGGAANSMPPPTVPHSATYPYYGRSGVPAGMGQYPTSGNPSGPNMAPSPFKASPSMPLNIQHNGMADKTPRNAASFNGSYPVSNYYAC